MKNAKLFKSGCFTEASPW